MNSIPTMLLLVFAGAFVASLGWTLGCGLAIAVAKHIELKLMAKRLQQSAECELRKVALVQRAQDRAELTHQPTSRVKVPPVYDPRGGAC